MADKQPDLAVVLVETATPSSKGSMNRYAALIAEAMKESEKVRVFRESVAPAKANLGRLPSFVKTLVHHASCWQNVKRLKAKHPQAILHIVDGSHGYLAHCLQHQRLVITIHDVIPALQAKGVFPVPPPGRAARWIIESAVQGLKKAAIRICDSTHTLRDYQKLSGCSFEQDCVIYPPLEPSFTNSATCEGQNSQVTSDSRTQPFVLHIGNNGFYKNRAGVIEIFALLATRIPHQLVMAGPPISEGLRNRLQALGISDRIRLIENPDDLEVKQLYRHADALIFPSLYEGFGWPPLEAMASGCPVICGDGGSLSEVVGNAAIVRRPNDILEFANQVEKVLCTPELSRELRKKGMVHSSQFTLEKFAAQLTRVYKEVAERT